MSTGATKEQFAIDEYGRAYDPSDSTRAESIIAAHRRYREWSIPDGIGMTWYDLEDFRQVGEWIVPPGMVIVPASSVPGPEVVEAIRQFHKDHGVYEYARETTYEQWLALTAWLDGLEDSDGAAHLLD